MVSKVFFLLLAVFLIFVFFLFNPFSKRGYGGSPSGFMVEGKTLYVLDPGIQGSKGGLIIFPPKSKPAIWIIDIDEKKLSDFKKIKNKNDSLWKKVKDGTIKTINSSSQTEITNNGKKYVLKSSGIPPYTKVPNEIQVKDQQGNLIATATSSEGLFRQLITDPKGDIYILGSISGSQFIYVFDSNSNQITKTVKLPLTSMQSIGFLDSKIYAFGTQSVQEYKSVPALLLAYDKNLDKLDEVLKIKSFDISGVIAGEKLFYAERQSLTSFKNPSVTIFDLAHETEDAKIIGEGIGPHPLASLIKIGLNLLALPILLLLGLLTGVFWKKYRSKNKA